MNNISVFRDDDYFDFSDFPTPEDLQEEAKRTFIIIGCVIGGVLLCSIIIWLIIFLICRSRRKKRQANANFIAPVVITSATHQTTNAGYPPQNIGVHTAPYPTGTQSGFQPFPMPQPTINTGFQPMPQPGAGYTPYPPNNNSAPYPPAVPTIQNTDAMNPPSYDQVVNAEPYQKQDAYNPNFKSQ